MLTFDGVFTNLEMKEQLGLLLAQLYPTSPAEGTVRLYQNNYTPSVASVLADFDEADFTGYAPVAIDDTALPVVRVDAVGNVYAVDPVVKSFAQTGTGTVNTVYGWFIYGGASGTRVSFAGRFASPIVFDHDGKAIELEIGYRLVNGGFLGGTDLEESA